MRVRTVIITKIVDANVTVNVNGNANDNINVNGTITIIVVKDNVRMQVEKKRI